MHPDGSINSNNYSTASFCLFIEIIVVLALKDTSQYFIDQGLCYNAIIRGQTMSDCSAIEISNVPIICTVTWYNWIKHCRPKNKIYCWQLYYSLDNKGIYIYIIYKLIYILSKYILTKISYIFIVLIFISLYDLVMLYSELILRIMKRTCANNVYTLKLQWK